MGKIAEFLFGAFDYEKLYHELLVENIGLRKQISDMKQEDCQERVKTEKRINDALTGNLAHPIIEKLRNDYVSVCNDRADLRCKLERYENTDLDLENKRLTTEIKCLKFKIEELEREKTELTKILDRYDVFFKSLSKE